MTRTRRYQQLIAFRPLSAWLLGFVLTSASLVQAEDKPTEIRIAVPGVGIGNRPVTGGSATSTAHLRGMLEEEFRKDGIKVTWTFLRGAGPAVNELYANNLVDISPLGDLPSIIGRASGLRTRVLLSGGRFGNSYVGVPADSPIQSIKDLRGKRVAVFKGTANQLQANRILAAHGLKENEVRTINMDTNASRTALVTKDIDASFGGSDLLALRDQGAVRIIYTTRNGDPTLTSNGTVIGSEAFLKRYPHIATRIVKVFLQAAKWIAEHESDPAQVYMLWTKSGVQFANYKEDYTGSSIKTRTTPLIDPYLSARYNQSIADAKRFGLIKETFKFEDWADPSFLEAALKQLQLEGFWTSLPAGGKPQS
jgi:sulfonate transport system substrate-binding protein